MKDVPMQVHLRRGPISVFVSKSNKALFLENEIKKKKPAGQATPLKYIAFLKKEHLPNLKGEQSVETVISVSAFYHVTNISIVFQLHGDCNS